MGLLSRIKAWFYKGTKPEPKPTVELMLHEVSSPGSRTQWGVDVVVNGHVRATHWFNKKPTKKQQQLLLETHR